MLAGLKRNLAHPRVEAAKDHLRVEERKGQVPPRKEIEADRQALRMRTDAPPHLLLHRAEMNAHQAEQGPHPLENTLQPASRVRRDDR